MSGEKKTGVLLQAGKPEIQNSGAADARYPRYS